MVQDSANLRPLGIVSEPYVGHWKSLGVLESSGLGSKVLTSGWKFFYMAGELRALVPAWGGQNTLARGIKRLLAQTGLEHFNCLEVTEIVRKHFIGIPYVSISAHSRHIQAGSQMQSVQQRAESCAVASKA